VRTRSDRGWRKLHNEELHELGGLCDSGFVKEKRCAHGVLMRNLKERDRLEEQEVEGSVLLK
jgi:hypothetical protein